MTPRAKKRPTLRPRPKRPKPQGAAAGPPNEVKALAGANQVDKMGAAKPGTFDKAAFIAAVAKAIDAAAPKNPEEATEFKGSGKTAEVKGQVSGLVTKGKDDSAQEIKTATTAPPDASGAKPKAITPMAPEQPGPPPAPVAGDQAMPAPRGPDQTELGAGPCAVNNKLADAEVTDDQLKKGNEPQFDQALDSKQKVEEHAAQAPPEVKAAEGAQLGQAQAGAAGTVASGLAAMHGGRAAALGGITAHKDQAKTADEAKRAEISEPHGAGLHQDQGRRGRHSRRPRPAGQRRLRQGRKDGPGNLRQQRRQRGRRLEGRTLLGPAGQVALGEGQVCRPTARGQPDLRPQPRHLPGQHAKGHLGRGGRGRLDPG